MKYAKFGGIFVLALICLVIGRYFSEVPLVPKNFSLPQKQVIGATTHTTSSFQTIITKVIDGDTILTKDGQKIRYIGMNAPETGQPYGKEATDFNKSLVLNKIITLVLDQQQKDQYGRLLGYVYVGSEFVNLAIVTHGWAVAESIPPNTTHKNEFEKAEVAAKKNCQGLWSDLCMPVSESCLKIINLHADASGIDDQNLNDEWIQIGNSCTNTINLSGWLLKDSSATHSYVFGNSSLAPQQSLKLHSGCGTNSFTDLYWQCQEQSHALWNNSGDEAMLFDSQGKLLSVYKY